MTISHSQIRESQLRLGLDLEEFSTFLGGQSKRTARHWIDGDRELSGAAEILLRLVLGDDLRHPDKAMRDRIMAEAVEVAKRRPRRAAARSWRP
ncbi:MAG: hypothetical protein ACREML_02785 [Vulcanimicrobiaceae bacterium]